MTSGENGDTNPAVEAYQGASRGEVTFIRDDQPYFVAEDGSEPTGAGDAAGPPCGDENTDYLDYVPWDGPGDEAIARRAAGLYLYTNDCPRRTTQNAVVPGGADPDWSPGGDSVVYVAPDANGVDQVFTTPYTRFGSGLGAATQITDEADNTSSPRWSPDGTEVEYTVNGEIKVVDPSSGATVSTIANAQDGAWQPVVQSTVNRIYGADAVGAAIAESQYGFADTGDTNSPKLPATAVVLARSDEYYDAIAGAVFARDIRAPLPVTPPSGLDPAVLTEIQRVLGSSGTVYLLGSDSSLSEAVEDSLTGAGFTTDRIAGTDLFDTAALVDQAIVTDFPLGPGQIGTVLLASGTSADDSLVAASAAGSLAQATTAIVLTNGASMPAASTAYLNTLNPATVKYVTIGGPATQALASVSLTWGPMTPAAALDGTDAIDTSVLTAEYFDSWSGGYGQANEVKVTSESSWTDALASGSLGTSSHSPLLLTSPSGGLTTEVQDYLEQGSGSISTVDDVTSLSDLAGSYDNQLGDAIGLPGQYTVNSLYSSQ
ncbi:MAG TPA: cell wall-binding repeat-containing protein [Actinocrinis sp.]